MHLLPSDFFSFKQVDKMFSAEYSEGDCLINIDDGKYRLYNPTGYTGVIIYRGWMLTVDEYQSLYDWLAVRGIILINNPAQYQHAHYISGWYAQLKEFTIPTEFEYNPEELVYPVFIKDQVKSNSGLGLKSVARNYAEYLQCVAELKQSRNQLEGNIVARQYTELSDEMRVFYLNGAPNKTPPFLVVLESNFYTVDYAFDVVKNKWVVVECGDGQVSDLKENESYVDLENK
jgi:hypothetical protein